MYKTKEQKQRFYKSSNWLKLRLKALKRDNYDCQQCKRLGKVSKSQNVHHKLEIEFYPEHALDIDNLETLCINCHNVEHGRLFGNGSRKKRWNDEKW